MELNSSFKLTEAGVIPIDWDCYTVGQLVVEGVLCKPLDGNHGDIHPKSGDFVSFGIPFVMANNVQNGRVDLANCVFLRKEQADSLLKGFSRPGDVLLTHKATIGNTAVVCEIPFEYVMLTPQVTYYRVANKAFLSNIYLRHYFDTNFFQRVLRTLAGGGTRAYIGITAQQQLPVVLPPTKDEQEAIAGALSDADALIESVEQLLAKKRQIKQGVMDELLTGRRRLPGFTDTWQEKTLTDLFNFSGGHTASRDQLGSDGYCYLHYGDIHTSSKTFVDIQAEFQDIPKLNISLKKVTATSLLDDGDVVFVDASEDDEGTSKHVVVSNPQKIPFISGLHTIVAKSKTAELEHRYKRFCFQTPSVKAQFRFFAVGTKVSGISKSNIAKITLPVPSFDEQAAIAAILSDMDAEVAIVDAKLTKARQIKQGMMQELLTGRIRLV